MFTQCPQCRTVFRLTTPMIRAAQGRVRCGRCSYVFNALTFFIDSSGMPVPAPGGPDESPPIPEEPRYDDNTGIDGPEESAPEAASGEIVGEDVEDVVMDDSASMVGDDVEEIVIDETASAANDASSDDRDIPDSELEFTAPDVTQVFVEDEAPVLPAFDRDDQTGETAEHEILDVDLESPESITLEGDSIVIVEGDEPTPATTPATASASAPASAEATAQPTPREGESGLDAQMRRDIEAAFASDPTTRAEFVLPSGTKMVLGPAGLDPDPTTDVEAAEQLQLETLRRRRVHRGWVGAASVFGLLLALQIVHHNRQALLGTATVGPLLARLYGGLGAELTPAWNVHAYELRQSGAAADPGASGTLRVRASLMNGADHAQPYPLLRLTLQDRFGARIGLLDVEPGEYLSVPPRSGELLNAGQRIDAEIDIVDPGKDAVGFEIDVCLRDKTAITCANDGARQAG